MAIEEESRCMAKKFLNAYIVAIFSCCRELYNSTKHCGGVSGPLKKAEETFRKIDEEIENKKQQRI